MSVAPHSQSLREQFAGRWQIPLLVVSGTMLVLGVWRLRPAPKPPSFDELYGHAVSLREAALYPEASAYIESLFAAPDRKPDEQAKLHLLMTDVIFAHESANVVHGLNNAKRILQHSEKAAGLGATLDARVRGMRAQASEWLQRPEEAVREYTAALQLGTARPWEMRKRVLEIERTTGSLNPDQLHTAYDAFLSGEDVSDELRYWAAECKVELCEQERRHDVAEQFLAAHAARFTDPMWRKAYDYLQALVWFNLQRIDDAERMLRTLRDQLPPGHSLYGRSGWLLGRILQIQESPEVAIGFFEEVINNTVPGPYRTAAILGKAECMAALERHSEAVEAYQEAIRLTTENPYGGVIDLRVVRESTTALYQAQLAAKRLPDAMRYLRVAVRLVPPADGDAQATYSRRLADLASALGKSILDEGDRQASQGSAAKAEARAYLIEAGEEYLKLAQVRSLSRDEAGAAVWQAVDVIDLAGDRARTVEVLKGFLAQDPGSPRAPMALLRLGQTYQAMKLYDKTIATYQQVMIDFPRTPSAAACLVPLADCFMTVGRRSDAEEVLLRIVVRRPDDPLTLITPDAGEYREALFRLGDLYMHAEEYEKAIIRYGEAVDRYRDDSRHDRAMFLLADSYRQSAARIRLDMQDARNVPFKDDLEAKHRQRMQRARELYDLVIEQYRTRAAASLQDLDRLYLKLSHFYRADVVYDLTRVTGSIDTRPLAESIDLYDRAAWLYQNDPMAMSAYVQMINCHLRMGNVDKARMALQRARWTLKSIPDEQFRKYAPSQDRLFWEDYLSWLEKTPAFVQIPSGMTS